MTWVKGETSLRTAEPDDADALLGYLNHPEVAADRQFGQRVPFPLSRSEVTDRLSEKSDTRRLFVIESDGVVVGHAEIGWWWDALAPGAGLTIDPSQRRRGHGRRAAAMTLDHLFEQTPAHVVTTEIGYWNLAGIAFAEAIGFSRAGAFRRAVKRQGQWQDVAAFDLLRREWEVDRAAR
ncbi:MAG: GNAT family protein [Acidimicrobiia bacterium]|nr:GNAT family protein [Acidimicrobiia bacterium]